MTEYIVLGAVLVCIFLYFIIKKSIENSREKKLRAMSTVPEAIVAGHCGMQVVGVSCITNMAAGVLPVKLRHEEVTETANRVKEVFQKLIDLIVDIIK